MFHHLARVACNYRLESPPCTVLRPLTSKLMLDPTIQAEGSIVYYRNDGTASETLRGSVISYKRGEKPSCGHHLAAARWPAVFSSMSMGFDANPRSSSDAGSWNGWMVSSSDPTGNG